MNASSGELTWQRHCWREYRFTPEDRDPLLRFDEVAVNEARVRDDVHFTALLTLGDRVICGTTHRGGDLLLEFDPAARSFSSLGFPAVAERHEVKLHRGLTAGRDGKVYFGTASLLHTADSNGTPGGRLVRYDPDTLGFEILGRPMGETYIQSICLDEDRGRVYGNTWPARYFFDADLRTGETRRFYVENVPEGAPCIDPDGYVWCTYGFWYSRYQFLCRYDPDSGHMDWTRVSLPGPADDDRPVTADEALLWRGRVHFAGPTLARLEHASMDVTDCGPPVRECQRIPALAPGPDGLLYGVAGRNGACRLFRYDGDTFRDLGLIGEPDGECAYIGHSICFHAGRVYVGETDNPERSGYLWEAELPVAGERT